MSNRYQAWAQQQTTGSPLRKSILLLVADAADDEGRSFKGQKTLAAEAEMSERSVRTHLRVLEQDRFIRRSKRFRKDGSRTSDYIHLPPTVNGKILDRWPATEGAELLASDEKSPAAESAGSEKVATGKLFRDHRQTVPSPPAPFAGHEPSVEPSVKNHQVTPPTPQGDSVAQARRDSKVDALFRAYNENRGKLPAAVKLTETRRRALRRLLKELGDEALPYLVDATLCVAADSFWQEKGYGLENLLVRGRVVAKAEQYRQLHKAKQSPVDPDDQPEPYTGPDVGDVVRLPNGLVRAVQDVDHFGNWLIFDDHPAIRPHEVQVVDQQGVLQ